MKRFLAFASLVGCALAGVEDGGGAASWPVYSTQTMAAAAVSSSVSKPTATSVTASVTASPTLTKILSVPMPMATGWPSSPTATYTVMVGGSSLVYTPQSLSGVKDKDTILFLFMQKNHTLTQSTFANPCSDFDGAFTSGFLPNNGTFTPFILVEFVDPTHTGTPLWFYCDQGNHCVSGMRFSINAPNDKDIAWRALDTTNATKTVSMSTSVSSSTATSLATASVVPGTGTIKDGQCTCDCLCGVNSFPTGAGIGMIGGLPGMIPAASGPSMSGTVSANKAYSVGSAGWK